MDHRRGLFLLSLLLVLGGATPVRAIDCPPADGRDTALVAGEAAGQNAFRRTLGPGWTLALVPAPLGWDIRVFDAKGVDLSRDTPPRISPNPREVYGWHFRNADNTGPNTGEVNAPQRLRLFTFHAEGDADRSQIEPEGRGALEIEDFGLADLEPGRQARMVYVKFSACLSWPAGMAFEVPVADETVEQFGACGLTSPLVVTGWMARYALEADFDGDGSWDQAALVARAGDGKRGIAICRAGTWLEVIGIEGDLGELQPAYFESVDWWDAVAQGPVGAGAGGAPPVLGGDAIVVGKSDSSSVLIFWNGEGFESYWMGD